MYLVLRKNQEILLSIDLNEYSFDQLIFGQEVVKEILIKKIIENNEDINALSYLYNLLKPVYKQADEVILIYKDNFYNVQHFPIKNIYYRTLHYLNAGTLQIEEDLSIRFVEDNSVKIDPNKKLLICDKNCSYFNNNYCNKYQEMIKNHICIQCFLEMSSVIKEEQEDKNEIFDQDRYVNS